jgi:endonuclease/exonuclease/phosphatase (EEP) superfamily protein YafD
MTGRPSRVSSLADWLVLAVGLVCLVAAGAAQAGRLDAQFDLLTHSCPFWLAGGLLAFVWGLFAASSRLRPALMAVGAGALLASGLLMAAELTRPIRPPVPPAPGRQIKLIQYNAWERNVSPKADADWLASQAPDVIVLEDAEEPITEALMAHGYIRAPGIADLAIFSRTAPIKRQLRIPLADWRLLPDIAPATFIGPDGAPFTVIGVHLRRPFEPSQMWGALTLADLIEHADRRRMIVAGDFNLTPWSFGLKRLDRRFELERRDRALFSWPSRSIVGSGRPFPFPFLPIDHIWAGPQWRTVKIERGPRLGSDHYPVVVTLALEE